MILDKVLMKVSSLSVFEIAKSQWKYIKFETGQETK